MIKHYASFIFTQKRTHLLIYQIMNYSFTLSSMFHGRTRVATYCSQWSRN